MKELIKRILRKILLPLIYRLGYVDPKNIDIHGKGNLIKNLIEILKAKNFQPNLIVDVGANHGTWSRVWKNEFPNANFILIEPQHWLKPSFEDLLDSKTIYIPCGAGFEQGSFKFTINKDRDDSSTFILNESEANVRGYEQIEMQVKPLNILIEEHSNIIPDIIKIDAEGLDLDVLKGADNYFGKTEMFLVETAINCTSMPNSISEIIIYMDKQNYRVFEITDINRPFSSRALWLTELAFIRKGGFLDSIDWQH